MKICFSIFGILILAVLFIGGFMKKAARENSAKIDEGKQDAE